jgi:hypothetical protein
MCHPQADLCLVHSKVLSFVDRHHQSLFNSLRNTNTSVSLFLICCSSSHQTIRPRHHQPIELCRDDSSHTFPDVYSSQSSLLLFSASRRTSHLVPSRQQTTHWAPPTCLRDHLCDHSSHDTAQLVAKEHLESRATEYGRCSSRPKAEQQCQACAAWRGGRRKGVLRKPSSCPNSDIDQTPASSVWLHRSSLYTLLPHHTFKKRRS